MKDWGLLELGICILIPFYIYIGLRILELFILIIKQWGKENL